MKESKPYPQFEEEDGSCLTAQEPAAGGQEPCAGDGRRERTADGEQ